MKKRWFDDWKIDYGNESDPKQTIKLIFPNVSYDRPYIITLKEVKTLKPFKGKKIIYFDRVQYALFRLVINLLKELK